MLRRAEVSPRVSLRVHPEPKQEWSAKVSASADVPTPWRPQQMPDWCDTCTGILAKDDATVGWLLNTAAMINHHGEVHARESAEVLSGRQYPSRGIQNTVAKTPPKVPAAVPYSISKFKAECRIARRNMGLAPRSSWAANPNGV
eukprot:gnl/TRDRNA2_/TRDRNA2_53622_c0_seq1.p1 gnl/TRDRNA2_/TRDRNA2_53622_c0~~gnl/TRDRNA2_/TRDRNA2_53622_c0_seq1.p1  ORF type:complete len:144 (+),score=20.57 gnl/TRDRNA2_/TRDRNA2_53622_c0_seq1:50-481(+)